MSVVRQRTRLPLGSRDPVLNIPGSLEEAKRFFSRLPPLPPGRRLVMSEQVKKLRRCHGCHGVNDMDHETFPFGADKCPLQHSVKCQGGIGGGRDRKGRLWRPCPQDYVCSTELSFSDASSSDDGEGSNHSPSITIAASSVPVIVSTQSSHGGAISMPPGTSTVVVNSSQAPTMTAKSQDTQLREELARMQQEREVLEEQALLQQQQRESAEIVELKRQLQAEKNRVEQLRKSSNPRAAQVSVADTFQRPDLPRNEFHSYYGGPTIKEIRKVKGLKKNVEYRIEDIRSDIPSLSHRPSATGTRGKHSPAPVLPSVPASRTKLDREFEEFKEFKAWKERQAAAVSESESDATPPRPQAGGAAADRVSDSSSSEGETQPMILVYRRDKNGKKYRIWEPYHSRQEPATHKYNWVTDPDTGREYKEKAATKTVVEKQTLHSKANSRYSDHRRASETPSTGHNRGVRSPAHNSNTREDRVPGIIPLDSKEGKPDEKKAAIIDWIRNCPVNYAEKIKLDEANLPLWVWGYLSEILASRTGLSPDMQRGELEARIQHLLCVLQVTLVHSEKSDFMNKGWAIASIYAKRVQQKLDRGLESWQDFGRFGHDPHPSEMFAAKTEADKKAPIRKKREEERSYGGAKSGQCTTWNNSEVEGKCKYLVDNPSASKCNRRHDCSYCQEKGHGTLMHQRRFCRKRQAAGDE